MMSKFPGTANFSQ